MGLPKAQISTEQQIKSIQESDSKTRRYNYINIKKILLIFKLDFSKTSIVFSVFEIKHQQKTIIYAMRPRRLVLGGGGVGGEAVDAVHSY